MFASMVAVPPDREPSLARSSNESERAFKPILHCLCSRTRCEPGQLAVRSSWDSRRCGGRVRMRRSGRPFLPGGQIIEVIDQPGFHFLARDDGIDQAVVEEELRGLKSGGQLGLGRV